MGCACQGPHSILLRALATFEILGADFTLALYHCQIVKKNDGRQNDFDPTFSRYDGLVIKASTPQNCLMPAKGCIEDSPYDQMKILITRFIKKLVKIVSLDMEGVCESA